MTQNREKPNASAEPERATRRGLGSPPPLDPRHASGAFPVSWPELPESEGDEVSELTSNWTAPPAVQSQPQAAATAPAHPQSRGPEYHPPSVPGAGRERGSVYSAASGTFRVGTPPSVQVRPPPAPGGAERPAPRQSFSFGEGVAGVASVRPGAARLASERLGAARHWLQLDGARLLSWVAVGLVLGGGLALLFVRVPVRAAGVLKVTGVPEVLGASVAGTITGVGVHAGDEVKPGDAVLQIRSPELEWNAATRRTELELLQKELEAATEEDKALARSMAALERRRQILAQRLELKDAELEARNALVEDVTALVNAGSVPATELIEAKASAQATSEAKLAIVDALSQLDIEVGDRRGGQRARERLFRSRVAEAEIRAEQAETALGVTTVKAPAHGWIESLSVTTGSQVQAGAELMRFVPHSAPRSVVALVAESDAAEVAPGEEATVELAARSGTARSLAARIRHVSREVAPPSRVQAILGTPGDEGLVQLELTLLDSSEYQRLEPTLRAGSRATVWFATPHRRLGSVLLAQLREWIAFMPWST